MLVYVFVEPRGSIIGLSLRVAKKVIGVTFLKCIICSIKRAMINIDQMAGCPYYFPRTSWLDRFEGGLFAQTIGTLMWKVYCLHSCSLRLLCYEFYPKWHLGEIMGSRPTMCMCNLQQQQQCPSLKIFTLTKNPQQTNQDHPRIFFFTLLPL